MQPERRQVQGINILGPSGKTTRSADAGKRSYPCRLEDRSITSTSLLLLHPVTVQSSTQFSCHRLRGLHRALCSSRTYGLHFDFWPAPHHAPVCLLLSRQVSAHVLSRASFLLGSRSQRKLPLICPSLHCVRLLGDLSPVIRFSCTMGSAPFSQGQKEAFQ